MPLTVEDRLDTEIIAWACENSYIVFTNDLDYGALLFATAAASPSVIQIRTEDIRPALPQRIYRPELLLQLMSDCTQIGTGKNPGVHRADPESVRKIRLFILA